VCGVEPGEAIPMLEVSRAPDARGPLRKESIMRTNDSKAIQSGRREPPGGRLEELSREEMRTLRGGDFQLYTVTITDPVTGTVYNTGRIERMLNDAVVCGPVPRQLDFVARSPLQISNRI
jgi:hypothetical protein